MIGFIAALLLEAASPPVSFEADSTRYDVDTRTIELVGSVVVTRSAGEGESEIVLRADRIAGRLDGVLDATGGVTIDYGPWRVLAERGSYDVAAERGSFENARFVEDSWFVRAAVLSIEGTDRFAMEDVHVTACDHDPPHYHFRVGSASYRDNRLRIRSATMRIGRTPVFWWPYLSTRVGGARPPFRIRLGKSDYEGYFVKMGYGYGLGRLGEGELKVDWRSHRGWGYGVEHDIALRRGSLALDLYRIDERDRGGRGVARALYRQEFFERVTARGSLDYVTDGLFLQDYRFPEFVSRPDPQSSASLSWRGDGAAGVLRVVTNTQRRDYDLVERLPELRWNLHPHSLGGAAWYEFDGGIAVFRHSHPYDSGATALARRDNPNPQNLVHLARFNSSLRVKKPLAIGAGFVLTPQAAVDYLAYEDDTDPWSGTSRLMPSAGVSLATFRRADFANGLSWSVRPVVEFTERGMIEERGRPNAIIEHIDQVRDARLVRLVLDQGLLKRRGTAWRERIRLRLDGGFDFDRVGDERYLPVTAKVSAWPGRAATLDGAVTIEPGRNRMRDALLELGYAAARLSGSASYYFRRGDAGVPDQENAGFQLEARLTEGPPTARAGLAQGWVASAGGSYNIERGRLDYARVGAKRYLHDFILGLEVTDQAATDRWDVRASVEMIFP